MSEFQSFGLPMPSGDGVGQTTDMLETDTPRTFIFHGARSGRFLVEASHDDKSWALLVGRDKAQAVFSGPKPVVRTIDAVVRHLRVRAVGTRGTPAAPTLDCGAVTSCSKTVFETMPIPADAGLGKVIDLGKRVGLEKTFILGGRLPPGTKYSVLGSVDGERFGELVRFPPGRYDRTTTVSALCRFLRVERIGRDAGPPITMGARTTRDCEEGGGGGDGDADGRFQLTLAEESAVSTGVNAEEEVLREFLVPLETLGGSRGFEATLAGFFAADGPGAGSALFKLRMGGQPGRPDGDTLIELEHEGDGEPCSATERVRTRPPSSPVLVKVTGQSSGKARAMARGLVITFQSLS